MVFVRLTTLQIEECGVSEKVAPISSTFSGVNTARVRFFGAFITLPVSQNFFTSQEIDDLFETYASSYSAVNAATVTAYDFIAR